MKLRRSAYFVVPPAGFEPAAFWFEARHSIRAELQGHCDYDTSNVQTSLSRTCTGGCAEGYTFPMFEGNSSEDELKKTDRLIDPNKYYRLKKDIETKRKKADLQKEKQQARKELTEKSKKLKEEMGKKGVVSADQKMKTEQITKQVEEQQAAQKEQGGTEQGSQTV